MGTRTSEYNRKRNFAVTTEPRDEGRARGKRPAHALQFTIQKHDARRLHYDFRLELDGTLKSWAVPKGPSLDPAEKRLAVHVEDHPLAYATFEGNIPAGHYGGGDVIVWDQGIWIPHGDPAAAYAAGKLKFALIGEKLSGDWTLVRTRLRASGDKEQWLLIKERDDYARPTAEYDIVAEQPESVISGEMLPQDQATKPTVKLVPVGSGKRGRSKPATKAKAAKSSRTALPALITPELATFVAEPPPGEWLYEVKFDGYRVMARLEPGKVQLFTRNGNDWTARMPQLTRALERLDIGATWLDGEVVVLDERGLPSFQALQQAFDIGRGVDIIYYLFDAPFLGGEDLRQLPVEVRRAKLEAALPGGKGPLRFSAAFTGDHKNIVQSACAMSLEGLIGKRLGSPYVSRRSGDWIKLKCRLRQEFVVVGYTEPRGSRAGFGALLLGVHAQGEGAGERELLYAGRVGTGFNETHLAQMSRELRRLERATPPVVQPPTGAQVRGVHWVEPTLVAEVEFAEWTSDGILRQAAFIALRSDKPASQIVRETPAPLNQRPESAVKPDRSTAVDGSTGEGDASTGEGDASTGEGDASTGEGKQGGKGKKTGDGKKAGEAKKGRGVSSAKASASARVNAPKSSKSGKTGAPDKKAEPVTAKARAKGRAEAEIAGVRISHPERVIDPESGATKLELAEFYAALERWILPHLAARPVALLRAPDGVAGEKFFQKHAENMAIPHMHHLPQALDPGHARLMEIVSAPALVGAAQMGTIELHTWGSTTDAIDYPDRFILDLDPDPALPWRSVVEAARLTLAVLDELELQAFLKTTGGKGLHVVVPLARKNGWPAVKGFSKAIGEFLTRQIPERFVAKMGPQNRIGKIFVDYLRNQRGASTVAAYSVRARPGLPVSVPIALEELAELKNPAQWNIRNLAERLAQQKTDPWRGYKHRQTITDAMWAKLGVKPVTE